VVSEATCLRVNVPLISGSPHFYLTVFYDAAYLLHFTDEYVSIYDCSKCKVMSLAWVALNGINGLGPARFDKLVSCFGSPEAVFEQSASRLRQAGLSESLVHLVKAPQTMDAAHEQLDKIRELGGGIITRADDAYPQCLREIFASPPILYVRGDRTILRKHAVAIVGARSPTVYGKQAARKIAEELTQRNLVVISGLARGIDTVAHEATLDSGGKTVAVLGSGIDKVFPASNRTLGDRIIANGCILSEFPLGVPPEAYNFPRRNRIISGCAAAVVVVEAGEKSGSLITARYALQQGREVCAVPGPITSPLSRGTFDLIKDGAQPVRSGHELAESLTTITIPRLQYHGEKEPRPVSETVFTQDERKVLEVLSLTQPQRVDTIAEQQEMNPADLFVILLNLELKGMVQQCSGQRYVKTGT
jgi:DNA processing protein